VEEGGYALLTLHRPSNVDNEPRLTELLDLVCRIAERIPVLFPVHPRTREKIAGKSLPKSLRLLEPLSYITFLGLMARSKVVLTDSGGIQEETTALQIPCLTLRKNTERPSTVELGTNELVGDNLDRGERIVDQIMRREWKKGVMPPLWDGRAACRVVNYIEKHLGEPRHDPF
jgi:UDP-N-acetylglucosamine 2-epimerase (non-hydrolysing)